MNPDLAGTACVVATCDHDADVLVQVQLRPAHGIGRLVLDLPMCSETALTLRHGAEITAIGALAK